MRSRYLTILLVCIAGVLAVVHNLAIQRGWYLVYPHIDIFMHLLGGVVLALTAFVFVISRLSLGYSYAWVSLIAVIIFTTLVAVGWEVFESFFQLTRDAGFGANTLSDVLFGIVGGAVGWSIATAVIKNPHQDGGAY